MCVCVHVNVDLPNAVVSSLVPAAKKILKVTKNSLTFSRSKRTAKIGATRTEQPSLIAMFRSRWPTFSLVVLTLLTLLLRFEGSSACLCHVLRNYKCPPPPHCCESGQYTFDECGCCMKCAKAELQSCGGPSGSGGKCAKGLACLKTCGTP